MPIYEYDCPKCGRFDVIQKMSAAPLETHDACGSAVTKLVSARTIYTVNPRAAFSGLLQYNSSTNTLSSNLRFRWDYQPGSELFVVYSDGRDTSIQGFPSLQNRSFAIKLTRLFRF